MTLAVGWHFIISPHHFIHFFCRELAGGGELGGIGGSLFHLGRKLFVRQGLGCQRLKQLDELELLQPAASKIDPIAATDATIALDARK